MRLRNARIEADRKCDFVSGRMRLTVVIVRIRGFLFAIVEGILRWARWRNNTAKSKRYKSREIELVVRGCVWCTLVEQLNIGLGVN